MAGTRFLNSYVKIVICLAGMACMGYFLYPALWDGEGADGMMVIRGLVFLGFTYLLIRSVQEIIAGSTRLGKD